MTWAPGPRPDWVAAVNSGAIWPMADAAAAPFTVEQVTAGAAATRGERPADVRDRLGDETLEPLRILTDALEAEARLTVLGRWITHRFLGRLVEQRLALDDYVRRDPGVVDEQIVEPWFVTGAPRTGTTVLHGVLAEDPRHRVPRGWELLFPAPPPADVEDLSARITRADSELRTPQVVASGLTAIHEYSAQMPKECLSAMSLCMRSEEFVARYHVPSYVTWLQSCDMTPAYAMHRLVLQVLQRRCPARRWVLKSPVHLHSLDALVDTYPDARISFTHRDPLAVLASVTSLVATMRSAHSDHVDPDEIGRYHAELYSRSLDALVDRDRTGSPAPGRTTHSRHDQFVGDAMAVVHHIYGHFGWDLPEPTAARMAGYLAAQPQAAPGEHRYDSDVVDLDVAQRRRLDRYRDRFLA